MRQSVKTYSYLCVLFVIGTALLYVSFYDVPVWKLLNPDSTTQGAIIQAVGTILGATFVIMAAVIQARAISQQVNAGNIADERVEQLNYLGWLSIAFQDLKRNAANDKLKSEVFDNLVKNDPLLDLVRKQVNRLDYFHPTIFIVGADARQFYAMLPYKIMKYLQDNEGAYHIINSGLQSLKALLLQPTPNPSEITRSTVEVQQGYVQLLKNYSEGFALVEPHIRNVREHLKDNFMHY